MSIDPNLAPETAAEFERTCCDIASVWRIKTIGNGRKTQASAWLCRTAYDLVEHLLSLDLWDEVTAPRSQRLSSRGRPSPPNPFRDVLRMIFINERKGPTEKVRSRIALRLAHAYWHFVPGPFLAGFLSQAGPNPIQGKVLPGFEWWLAQELSESRNAAARQTYRKSVKKAIKGYSRRYWREPH